MIRGTELTYHILNHKPKVYCCYCSCGFRFFIWFVPRLNGLSLCSFIQSNQVINRSLRKVAQTSKWSGANVMRNCSLVFDVSPVSSSYQVCPVWLVLLVLEVCTEAVIYMILATHPRAKVWCLLFFGMHQILELARWRWWWCGRPYEKNNTFIFSVFADIIGCGGMCFVVLLVQPWWNVPDSMRFNLIQWKCGLTPNHLLFIQHLSTSAFISA